MKGVMFLMLMMLVVGCTETVTRGPSVSKQEVFVPDYSTPISAVDTWLYALKTGDKELFQQSLSKYSLDRYYEDGTLDKAFNTWSHGVRESNIQTTGSLGEGNVYNEDAIEVGIGSPGGNQISVTVVKENGLWKVREN